MQDVQIIAYRTHIEISPYHEGDCGTIERMLSRYDYVCHKWIRIGYYIHNNTLYIPRGVSLNLLYKLFNSSPQLSERFDPMMKAQKANPLKGPKSEIQEECMDFLLSRNSFAKNARKPQLSLNADTGDGKTYSAVYAALTYGYKTIIITHENSIKAQWLDSFQHMTDIDMNRVLELNTQSMEILMRVDRAADYDIYLVNHQTITSFAKNNGWDAVREFFKKHYIGIKIVDEAHKFFENSMMIDFFSNTFKTLYLTATFLRNDRKENQIYSICYSETIRFGEQTFDYESKRKHIIAVVVFFRSRPDIGEIIDVSTRRGFSVYKYIDYEFNESNHTLMKVLDKIMAESDRLEGKRLILVPKKSTIDYVADTMEQRYPRKTIGKIYSDNTPEENEKSKDKDIIISTAKSSGTGLDIKGLRVMYNLEPIGSPGYMDQVRGRLREYSSDKDTFFYYLVDTTIPECNEMYRRILPVLRRKCKEVIEYRIDDI